MTEKQLKFDIAIVGAGPASIAAACEAAGQQLNLRKHEGYDHSYFFIASFIDDHIRHHATILK